MAETITAYGGGQLPINSLDQVFGYDDGSNAISNTVEYEGITYVQSYIRDDSGNVIEVTQYIPAPMFEYDFQGRLIKIASVVKNISLEKNILRLDNGKVVITTTLRQLPR